MTIRQTRIQTTGRPEPAPRRSQPGRRRRGRRLQDRRRLVRAPAAARAARTRTDRRGRRRRQAASAERRRARAPSLEGRRPSSGPRSTLGGGACPSRSRPSATSAAQGDRAADREPELVERPGDGWNTFATTATSVSATMISEEQEVAEAAAGGDGDREIAEDRRRPRQAGDRGRAARERCGPGSACPGRRWRKRRPTSTRAPGRGTRRSAGIAEPEGAAGRHAPVHSAGEHRVRGDDEEARRRRRSSRSGDWTKNIPSTSTNSADEHGHGAAPEQDPGKEVQEAGHRAPAITPGRRHAKCVLADLDAPRSSRRRRRRGSARGRRSGSAGCGVDRPRPSGSNGRRASA